MDLVCMRLVDMGRVHPGQDNSRVCAGCGFQVGIYPSGQGALKANPGLRIICHKCAEAERDEAIGIPAAPWSEIRQESRDSVDVKKP